jgi:type I restriction enzyme R subunit
MQAQKYEEYLAKLVELTRQVANPAGGGINYPRSLNTAARRALYDNLDQNEALTLSLDQEILNTRHADWRGNIFKVREIRNVIYHHISNETDVERILELVKNQHEY